MSTLVSTFTKSWGRLDTFHIMKNHSTTRCGELLKPEMLFVLVNVSEQFEELLCAWWACALHEVVLFECEHLTLGELLPLESDVPAGFVLHGVSP